MTKLLKTIIFIIICYILPLLGNIDLFLNWRIFFLMIAFIIMLHTQPEIKIREAREKKSTDMYSIFFISFSGILSQIFAVVEWGYFQPNPTTIKNPIIVIAGFCMLFSGLVFRY